MSKLTYQCRALAMTDYPAQRQISATAVRKQYCGWKSRVANIFDKRKKREISTECSVGTNIIRSAM